MSVRYLSSPRLAIPIIIRIFADTITTKHQNYMKQSNDTASLKALTKYAVCCAMALILSMTVVAKTAKVINPKPKSASLRKEMKAAYKYRTDIPKDVLAMTKKWPDKFGIPHSDWIENLNGHSIDLQGREILSWLDYVQLELCCDTFFVATMADGKKGVYGRSSEQSIVPYIYDEIDFSWTALSGTIVAKMNTAGGTLFNIYTTTGQRLDFQKATTEAGVFYYASPNIIDVIWRDETNALRQSLYWPNGKPAFEEDLPGVKITFASDGFKYTPQGDSTAVIKYYINTDEERPRLQVLTKNEMISRDKESYTNNVWKQMAVKFMEQKRYSDIAFCMDFINRHELKALRSQESEPNFECYTMGLYAYTMAGNYKTVIYRTNGTDTSVQRPSQLLLNTTTGEFYIGQTNNLDAAQRKSVEAWAKICTSAYSTSMNGQEQKQIQQAQTAAAIFGAIGGTLNAISQGMNSGGNRQSSTQSRPQKVSASHSSSSSSSSSAEPVSTPTRETCTRCNGTGRIEVERSVKTGGLEKRMKTCSECGKSYDSAATGHHHETCGLCHGAGYYELR